MTEASEAKHLEADIGDGKGLGEEVDKIMAEEIKNNGDEQVNYEQILDEDERQSYENMIKALHYRDKFEEEEQEKGWKRDIKNGKVKDPHHLHEYLAFILGSSLTSMGFLYNKVFLTFAVVGFIVTTGKSIVLKNGEGSKMFELIRNHPVYYLLGMASFSLMFIYAGYQVPPIDLSLTELVVNALIGA